MKHTLQILALAAVTSIVISSCSSNRPIIIQSSGAERATTVVGGEDTGVIIEDDHPSNNSLDLVPIGNRITYTIDIGTDEGMQKLQGLSLNEAKELAGIEASRKYNCDSFIKQRTTYLLSKDRKRILRVTIDGRPANYKTKSR